MQAETFMRLNGRLEIHSTCSSDTERVERSLELSASSSPILSFNVPHVSSLSH